MIRRENDAPATEQTLDAPAWLQPGAVPLAHAPTLDASVQRSSDGDAPAAPPAAPHAPPRRIAQFVLLDRIGAGGMGEVFAAFDDKLERKVAIKLVATQGSGDRSIVATRRGLLPEGCRRKRHW